MKKRLILLSCVALLACFGCSKERQCKCQPVGLDSTTTADGLPDASLIKKIITITADHGLKCSDITKMGFETQNGDTSLVRTMDEVTCEEL